MWLLFLIIVLSVGGAICLLSAVILPLMDKRRMTWQGKQEKAIAKELDKMFYYDKSPRQIVQLYYILPPLLALIGFVLSKSKIALFAGPLLGLTIPTFILRIRDARRRKKFQDQLLDAIMLLSSCLKGGLSLLQSFEVLVEEMPAPISQEFGLAVRENKMGVTLEDSLRGLNRRMNMEELNLVVNSVLVARETGGDLTKVFSRLCTTIRDNMKLKENIQTLTLQGRLQGLIMTALPIVFFFWVMQNNKHHFDIMLESELGRTLLVIAVVLQVIGMFLIRKFSIIKA